MPHTLSPPDDPAVSDAAGLAALFAPFEHLAADGLVLAVSGGSDSIGLMHRVARWLALPQWQGRETPSVHVATIDHGLRAGSAADAEFVIAAAQALGFSASCRRWEGPKPRSGLAEAAREARYALLAESALQVGAHLVMTAHTADDQAETLLMRLARGSGLDGLAGMAPLRPLGGWPGLSLARPLLGLAKADIARDLEARGIAWREDPTNRDLAYERPRIRDAQATLGALGLTPERLGLAARRLRRAAEALEAAARAHLQAAGRIDPLGVVTADLPALLSQPDEIVLRVLRRGIEVAGGPAAPVPMGSLETVLEDLRSGTRTAWTLSRAAVKCGEDGRTLAFEREPGRDPLPRLAMRCGRLVWDNRYLIEAGQGAERFEVGPLGPGGLKELRARAPLPAAPARVLHAVPAVWAGDALVAVPLLGVSAPAVMQLDVRITLIER